MSGYTVPHISIARRLGWFGLRLFAILAIVLFGIGFTIHWLFILAVIAALLFVISMFMGGVGGRRRGAWW